MIGLALSFLRFAWPYLLALGVAWYGWHLANGWCNGACKRSLDELEIAQASLKAAQERATALALLWAAELDKVKVQYKDRVVYRTQTFGGIRERVGKISTGVAIPVDPDTRRLLADITSVANDTSAAGGDTQASAPVPDTAVRYDESVYTELRDWVGFAAEAAESYREAADKHQACVAAYDSLSKSTQGNE